MSVERLKLADFYPEKVRPPKPSMSEYKLLLPEPASGRKPSHGVAISDTDSFCHAHNTFWAEKDESGYTIAVNILDVASGENNMFSSHDLSPRKTLTIKTKIDTELLNPKFEIGFTETTPLAFIGSKQNKEIVGDSSHELHPLVQDFYAIASSLQRGRIEAGALDFIFAWAKVMEENETLDRNTFIKETATTTIASEFLHLAKRGVSEAFAKAGIPALYMNQPPATSELLREDIQERAIEVYANPTKDKLIDLRALLRSNLGLIHYDTFPHGHYLSGGEALVKFTVPTRRVPDRINSTILREMVRGGDLPYSIPKLQGAADLLNARTQAGLRTR